MTTITDSVSLFLKQRGYSPRTTESYLHWVRRLELHFPDRDISSLLPEDVASFFQHLQARRLGAQSVRRPEARHPRPRRPRYAHAGNSPCGRRDRSVGRSAVSRTGRQRKAINGRRALPISRWPKCPQSTCICSPGKVRSRRKASRSWVGVDGERSGAGSDPAGRGSRDALTIT
jgi:hypothetical protein